MLTFDTYAALLRPILLNMQKERGEAPFMLARRLNRRGLPTWGQARWTEALVLAVLQKPAATLPFAVRIPEKETRSEAA